MGKNRKSNRFGAGQGKKWHIHKDHIKFGNNNDTRVNFYLNTTKAVDFIATLDNLRPYYRGLFEGDNLTSLNVCLNWVRKNLR